MRSKYQNFLEQGEESKDSVRGRPLGLGSMDGIVREAVLKLRDKGEKVNAFAVLAVAKQV